VSAAPAAFCSAAAPGAAPPQRSPAAARRCLNRRLARPTRSPHPRPSPPAAAPPPPKKRRRIDSRVNVYPSMREFTAIGSGGSSFRQSMVNAVAAVVGRVECVSQRCSAGARAGAAAPRGGGAPRSLRRGGAAAPLSPLAQSNHSTATIPAHPLSFTHTNRTATAPRAPRQAAATSASRWGPSSWPAPTTCSRCTPACAATRGCGTSCEVLPL
jgi:hypothetical protein